MKRIKRIVAVTGKYTDRDGNEKNQYATIGGLFEREDGTQAIKIDNIPVGGSWNGWASLFELEDQRKPTAHDEAKANGYQKQVEDEIPY